MIEFLSLYLTLIGGVVGVVVVVFIIAVGLRYLFKLLEPKVGEDWAFGVNLIIVFLLVVLLFTFAIYFGGEPQ